MAAVDYGRVDVDVVICDFGFWLWLWLWHVMRVGAIFIFGASQNFDAKKVQ